MMMLIKFRLSWMLCYMFNLCFASVYFVLGCFPPYFLNFPLLVVMTAAFTFHFTLKFGHKFRKKLSNLKWNFHYTSSKPWLLDWTEKHQTNNTAQKWGDIISKLVINVSIILPLFPYECLLSCYPPPEIWMWIRTFFIMAAFFFRGHLLLRQKWELFHSFWNPA